MYGTVHFEWIKGSGHRYPPRPKPWVAHLTALDEQWGFKREFIRAVYDYTHARGKWGGRGIYLYFALPPGLYECFEVLSWKHDRRFFIRVNGQGDIAEIEREEVESCLRKNISE